MLNTDLHNPSVKNRMTKHDFVRNNRGINGGSDVPLKTLEVRHHVAARVPPLVSRADTLEKRGWEGFCRGSTTRSATKRSTTPARNGSASRSPSPEAAYVCPLTRSCCLSFCNGAHRVLGRGGYVFVGAAHGAAHVGGGAAAAAAFVAGDPRAPSVTDRQRQQPACRRRARPYGEHADVERHPARRHNHHERDPTHRQRTCGSGGSPRCGLASGADRVATGLLAAARALLPSARALRARGPFFPHLLTISLRGPPSRC